jgi:hypothetical protein
MVVHSAHDSPHKPIEIAVTAFDCGQRNSDQQAAPPGTTQARLGQKKIGVLPKAQDGRASDPAIPDAFLDRAISRRQKNLLDMNAAEFRQLALGKRLRSMGPQFNCLPRLSAESMSPT